MPTTAVDVEIPATYRFLFDPPLGEVRYRVAHGGRGSAKSWQFARAAIIHATRRPMRVLCAREFQNSIRDSVHTLLEKQMELIGLRDFFEVQQTTILGANGSEFIFEGVRRNVQEIKSTEGIDLCWVEEAESVSEESWRVLTPTIREPGSEIWVTFNPALPSDPTYRRFVEDPPENAIVRHITYEDNPWLPEVLREEAENLKRRDPDAYAHVWEGQPWERTDAQVLSRCWEVESFEPESHWDGPYFGADWGFARDPTVLVKLWIADSRLYVEHEEGGIQLGMDATERRFRRVPGAEEHTIRADNARPETIAEMKKRGLDVEGAPKWKGSVEDGIEHLRSYESIVIHPRCERAIEEARMWRYKTDNRTGDVLPKLRDGYDHVWDATRYALAPVIQQSGRKKVMVGP